LKACVCDASVFLSGHLPAIPMGNAITTPEVVAEVRSVVGRCVLEVAISEGLTVQPTREECVEHAQRLTEALGDLPKLSRADLSVIAKALEVGGTVVSDDYDVQNVCAKLGIPFRSVVQKGIEKSRQVVHVCPACRRKWRRGGACPVCGTPLRTRML